MKNAFYNFRLIINSLAVILFVMFSTSGNVFSQQKQVGETSKTYLITLNDGSTITARLISSSENEIVIESPTMGKITLERAKIKSMVEVSAIDEKKSGIWFPNPNPTKYLLGNSAIPFEKGSGYYQNTWVFFSSLSYAFTNNISLSGGFELFSIMAGGDGPFAFYINPKASFKIANNFYAGANIMYANTIRTIDEFGGLATLNGFITYGNRNNNITAALGWGLAEGEFSSEPLITISGMARASKRIAFVSENWVVPGIGEENEMYGIFSYGIRFLGEKISVDLAFLNNKDIAEDIFIGIPWLDFVFNF